VVYRAVWCGVLNGATNRGGERWDEEMLGRCRQGQR
jgi:hypothetical protein